MNGKVATPTTERTDLPTPGDWAIDPAHSAVTAVAKHLMVSKVRGSFKAFSGIVHIDADPERSRVEVEIDAASIDTGEPKRDEHLRSPDFLDASTFPRLRYVSTSLTPTGPETFRLDGELTIRAVTRPVSLDVVYEGTAPDPWGGTRAGFSATGEIDRDEFGITWNQALETGGVLVGKKLKVELDIQAVRQAA